MRELYDSLIKSFKNDKANSIIDIRQPEKTFAVLTQLNLIDFAMDSIELAIHYARLELLDSWLPAVIRELGAAGRNEDQDKAKQAYKNLKYNYFVDDFIVNIWQINFQAAMIFLSKPMSCFGSLD